MLPAGKLPNPLRAFAGNRASTPPAIDNPSALRTPRFPSFSLARHCSSIPRSDELVPLINGGALPVPVESPSLLYELEPSEAIGMRSLAMRRSADTPKTDFDAIQRAMVRGVRRGTAWMVCAPLASKPLFELNQSVSAAM